MLNRFWIAANIMFDLQTGKKSDVLLLVNNEGEATTFTEKDATDYLRFVAARAPNIGWSLQPSRARRAMFVIQGVQNV